MQKFLSFIIFSCVLFIVSVSSSFAFDSDLYSYPRNATAGEIVIKTRAWLPENTAVFGSFYSRQYKDVVFYRTSTSSQILESASSYTYIKVKPDSSSLSDTYYWNGTSWVSSPYYSSNVAILQEGTVSLLGPIYANFLTTQSLEIQNYGGSLLSYGMSNQSAINPVVISWNWNMSGVPFPYKALNYSLPLPRYVYPSECFITFIGNTTGDATDDKQYGVVVTMSPDISPEIVTVSGNYLIFYSPFKIARTDLYRWNESSNQWQSTIWTTGTLAIPLSPFSVYLNTSNPSSYVGVASTCDVAANTEYVPSPMVSGRYGFSSEHYLSGYVIRATGYTSSGSGVSEEV